MPAPRRKPIRHRRGPKRTIVLDMMSPKLKDMREITEPIAERLKQTAQRELWPSSKIQAKGLKKAASIARTMKNHKQRFPNPRRFMLEDRDIEWAADLAAEWLSEP